MKIYGGWLMKKEKRIWKENMNHLENNDECREEQNTEYLNN